MIDGAVDAEQAAAIGAVTFTGFGVFGTQPTYSYRAYANDTAVVLAYQYLLQGAAQHAPAVAAAQTPPTAALSGPASAQRESKSDLVGPFTATGSTALRLTLAGAQPDVRLFAAADATPVEELIVPAGAEFWVFPGTAPDADFTVQVTGSAAHWVSARTQRPAFWCRGPAVGAVGCRVPHSERCTHCDRHARAGALCDESRPGRARAHARDRWDRRRRRRPAHRE